MTYLALGHIVICYAIVVCKQGTLLTFGFVCAIWFMQLHAHLCVCMGFSYVFIFLVCNCVNNIYLMYIHIIMRSIHAVLQPSVVYPMCYVRATLLLRPKRLHSCTCYVRLNTYFSKNCLLPWEVHFELNVTLVVLSSLFDWLVDKWIAVLFI